MPLLTGRSCFRGRPQPGRRGARRRAAQPARAARVARSTRRRRARARRGGGRHRGGPPRRRPLDPDADVLRPGMERFLQRPLADDVRYSGEPVAVVVAESRYVAEDALELIEVEYEPLPPVVDVAEALAPGAAAARGGRHQRRRRVPHRARRRRRARSRPPTRRRERLAAAAATPPCRSSRAAWWPSSSRARPADRLGRGQDRPHQPPHPGRLLGWPEERIRFVELARRRRLRRPRRVLPRGLPDPLLRDPARAAGRLDRGPARSTCASINHSREQVHRIAIALDGRRPLPRAARRACHRHRRLRAHPRDGRPRHDRRACCPGPTAGRPTAATSARSSTNKTPAGTYRAPGRYEANFARERIDRHRRAPARRRPGRAAPPQSRRAERDALRERRETDGHRSSTTAATTRCSSTRARALRAAPRMRRWRDEAPARSCGVASGSRSSSRRAASRSGSTRASSSSRRARRRCYRGSASVGQGVETVLAQICADTLGVPATTT